MPANKKILKTIAAGLLAIILSGSHTFAFSSFDRRLSTIVKYIFGKPFGFIHREITLAAMKDLQIREDFQEKIAYWNWRPDWDETQKIPPGFLPNKCYKPEHHFDRNEIAANFDKHTEAFSRGAAYVREQRLIAVDGLKKQNGRDVGDTLQAIGRAFHALQDVHSHSNIIDLDQADLNAAQKALMQDSSPPGKLKITAYGVTEGGVVKGDAFSHDIYSKDEQEMNPEAQLPVDKNSASYDVNNPNRTKFEAARDAAIEFSRRWLESIRDEAGPEAWARMMNETGELKIRDEGCQAGSVSTE